MISSPGWVCLTSGASGPRSTRAWTTSWPSTLRSCCWRSVRQSPGACWTAMTLPPLLTAPCGLAEGEGVGLDAGIQEGDLEGVLADRAGLAEELVQPRVGDRAVALVVQISSVGGSRGLL